MWSALQRLTLVLYITMPPALLALNWWRARRGSFRPILMAIAACTLAMVAGSLTLGINAVLLGGSAGIFEFALISYLILAFFCMIRAVDWLTMRSLLLCVGVRGEPGSPRGRAPVRRSIALLLQRVLLLAIIVPCGVCLLAMYRPRLQNRSNGDPMTRLGLDYSEVAPLASDGVQIAAWWIPARPAPNKSGAADWRTHRTVIIAPGLGLSKESLLGIFNDRGIASETGPLRSFVVAGYNVLVLDLRAQGDSAGRLTTFGAAETRDVLGAVAWLKARHPAESQRIFGIGLNIGAAAMVAAAAEDSPAGRSIDALVLAEPYANFDELAGGVARRLFPIGAEWLFRRVAPLIVSLHGGENLMTFSPADAASHLWPRALLVVHGRQLTWVPPSEERELFHAAAVPRDEYWPSGDYEARRAKAGARTLSGAAGEMLRETMGVDDNILNDPGVQRRILDFLHDAEPVPVI